MRTLPYLLVAVGLLTGCPTSTTDTEDTSGGKDTTDTSGGDTQDTQDTQDTDTGSSSDTGYSAVYFVGGFEVAQGQLQSVYTGYQFTTPDFAATACDVALEPSDAATAATDCPDCEWAYKYTNGEPAVTGDGCASVDASGFTGGATGMGWAASYTFVGPYYTYYDSNVVFKYFDGYGWYEYVYNNDTYGSAGYVSGDGASGEFYKLLGYTYYYY